jgi:hypothetical protein
MQKPFSLGLASLLVLAAPGLGKAQDVGAVISESAPVAFLRGLSDKLTGGSPPQAVVEPQQVEEAPVAAFETGPARADEVLSARSKAVMAKRDGFGAPETPIICTNCAD